MMIVNETDADYFDGNDVAQQVNVLSPGWWVPCMPSGPETTMVFSERTASAFPLQ